MAWSRQEAEAVRLRLMAALGDGWDSAVTTWIGEDWMGSIVHIVSKTMEMRVHCGALDKKPVYWTRVYPVISGDVTRGYLVDALYTIHHGVADRLQRCTNAVDRADSQASIEIVARTRTRVDAEYTSGMHRGL